MNEKIAIGLIGVVLSVLLVIQIAGVSAQQIVANGSSNSTSNTTVSNTTVSNTTASNTTASNSTNTTSIRSAFDQLKDTFGSLFGK